MICPLCDGDDEGYAHPQDSHFPTAYGEKFDGLTDDVIGADPTVSTNASPNRSQQSTNGGT